MDWIEELSKMLDGAKFTFSRNCSSGLIGNDKCECWRCKQERGETPTRASEAFARRQAVEEHRKLVNGLK